MTKQITFIIFLILAVGMFIYTIRRLLSLFSITKKDFKVDRIPERIKVTILVAFGQTKIFRKPGVGLLHALVWWGFIVITIGTGEMVIDGIAGTERVLALFTGWIYDFITSSGDIFAAIIIFACFAFFFRRFAIHVKRFSGIEMTKKSAIDATAALTMILLLMVSLIGMNMGYTGLYADSYYGLFPVSNLLMPLISGMTAEELRALHEVSWWTHIILVFVFLNVLPYSKHFHVIMSVPNVFLSRLEPMTKLNNMDSVKNEVNLMMNPDKPPAVPPQNAAPSGRFGVKDIEDVTWKSYVDSLTCTECGRCTSVCPANITGKKLSPRKLFIDLRKRMNEKGPHLAKDPSYNDGKSLVGDYISAEELWACTTCNACVQECPVNIDHVSFIVEMRRNLVMEESAAPSQLIQMFSNIENNGSPWQFSPEDRLKWAENISL